MTTALYNLATGLGLMFDLAFSANCSAIGILLLLQLTAEVVVAVANNQSVEEECCNTNGGTEMAFSVF